MGRRSAENAAALGGCAVLASVIGLSLAFLLIIVALSLIS